MRRWGTLQSLPGEYSYQGASCCRLSCGGRVVYYTLAPTPKEAAGGGEGAAALLSPTSPRTVLHHVPSFHSSLQAAGAAGAAGSAGTAGSVDGVSSHALSSGGGDAASERASVASDGEPCCAP